MKKDMPYIYFDNAASTPVDPAVAVIIKNAQELYFGNPSSIHTAGQQSKVQLEHARSVIASAVGAQSSEIIFTSGGTESNNLAVLGAAQANKSKGHHIISTKIEHQAVLESLKYLSNSGFTVSYIDIDENGFYDPGQLDNMITGDTFLISVMMANNETGHLLNLEEIRKRAARNNIIFHSDAVQAFGKVDFNVCDLGIDLLSISGHKIYGPKGIGALYVNKDVVISHLSYGGSQEVNQRAGTENLSGIIGFAAAVEQMQMQKEEKNRIKLLRDRFEKQLADKIPGSRINCGQTDRLYTHSNIYFPDISGDAMVISLDVAGIAASSGSACSSGSTKPSHVLASMGMATESVKNSVRFSFGRFNKDDEIDYAVEQIGLIYNRIRNLK